MEKFTVDEFKRYCLGKKIEQVIFHTDNREQSKAIETADPLDPMKAALSFEQIRFDYIPGHPPKITLKSPIGSIWFNGVKHILLHESPAWTEAQIVCEYKSEEKAYSLLIDYTPDK